MDLMDLRGPDFLKVYAGLFILAIVISSLVIASSDQRFRRLSSFTA